METVGTGLDARTDDAAHEVAEFGRGVTGDQVKFLNSIRSRSVAEEVIRHLVVVHTVEQEVVGLFAIAVDERTRAVTASVVSANETAGVGGNRARGKERQLHVISGGERQVVIGGRVHNGIDLRRFGLEDGSSTSDFNGLANLAYLQLDIEASYLVER